MHLRTLTLLAAFGVTAGACGVPEALRPSLQDAPTHERYTAALSEFGLHNVALGQDWLSEAQRALTSPLPAPAPFCRVRCVSGRPADSRRVPHGTGPRSPARDRSVV